MPRTASRGKSAVPRQMPRARQATSSTSQRTARAPATTRKRVWRAAFIAGAAYDPADAASFLAATKKTMESEPDFDGLLSELDAGRIYAEYVELFADAAQK